MYSCNFFFFFTFCSSSSSSFFHFAFVRTLLYFSSFIPVLCAMFFRLICWSTHSHTHTKFQMLWQVSFSLFFFCVPSCTRTLNTFPKNQTWIHGGHKVNASAFPFVHWHCRQNSMEKGIKSDYLSCVTSASKQAYAHGYFIDDMMFYAFEIIPFHLHDTLFPGSTYFTNRSALLERACLYLCEKYGYVIIFFRRTKRIIRYTHTAPSLPRSHLGFEYLP